MTKKYECSSCEFKTSGWDDYSGDSCELAENFMACINKQIESGNTIESIRDKLRILNDKS